jgi:signal peptidase
MEKTNSIKNKILSISVTLVLFLTIALCIFVMFQVFTQGYASFGGFSMFRVATGSMGEEIPIKSLILVKRVDIQELEVGDIVTFSSQIPDMAGMTITHRVVEKELSDNGEIRLKTRGDANPSIDSYYLTADNLIGKVIWCSGKQNFFADFISFFTGKVGFLAFVAFPCLLIAGMILRECVGNIKNDMKKALQQIEAESAVQQDIDHASALSTGAEAVQDQAKTVETSEQDSEYEQMRERIRAELMEELKQQHDREQ